MSGRLNELGALFDLKFLTEFCCRSFRNFKAAALACHRRARSWNQTVREDAMAFPRRKFLKLAAGALALPAVSRAAYAQSWPSRVVRLVVGFPAGGGNDAVARIVANRLSEIWGQQVIVENKGGAGGNLAFETVARAAPDGHTMLVGFPGLVTNQFLYSSINYDPVADFAAVSLIGTYGNLLV